MQITNTPAAKSKTAAQQLAEARAADVVPNILGAIAGIRKQSKRIAWCALAAITPHAIVFLSTQGGHHGNLFLTIFSVITAALVCITIDLGMVTMLSVVQTPGVRKAARRTALGVLFFLMLVSGTIQFLAPGFLLMRILLGMTVLILVLVEVVASLIDVDPELLGQIEAEAIAVAPPAEPVKPAGRTCPTGCTCGKHTPKAKAKAPAAKKTTARQTPATKRNRTRTTVPADAQVSAETVAEIEAIKAPKAPVMSATPVSPAPGLELDSSGLWLPAGARS